MKLQHKVHLRRSPDPEPISERYQAEIDRSVRRAEKAWRAVERRRVKAEKRASKEPTPGNVQALELVRAEAERLWREFEELDRLMRGAPVPSANRGSGQVRHRTGRDDRLHGGTDDAKRRTGGAA